MKTYTVALRGEEFQIGIEDGRVVAINGERCIPVSMEQTSRHQYSVLLNGLGVTVAASGSQGSYEVFTEANLFQVRVTSERERFRKQFSATSHGPVRTEIRAPMPALVVKVEVNEGDSVREGQGLVILEAMKMENEIRAHTSGKVKQVLVAAGKAVEKDEVLIHLE